MEFKTVVENRRSIRQYEEKKVSHEELAEVLRMAQMAPSWKNSQTARMYVVESDEMLAKVKEECLPSFNRNNVANASALIVSTFIPGISGFGADGAPMNACGDGWGYYDLGMHDENLCLAAASKGLGTLVMGIRHEDAIRRLLQIPENQVVVSIIGIGYPAVAPAMPKRKELEEVVTFC